MTRTAALMFATFLMMLPVMAGAQSAGDSSSVPVADSARSESELRAASTRYAGAVKTCYEREGLKTDPALTATVDVGLTVQPNGTVGEISVDTIAVRGVGISVVAQCVAKAASTWRFTPGAYPIERTILSFKLVPPRSN